MIALLLMLSQVADQGEWRTGFSRSGAEILRRCDTFPATNQQEHELSNWCNGYIAALADLFTDEKNAVICFRNVTIGDLRDSVVKYLKTHPDELEYDAHSTIKVVWQDAYPCGPMI